MPTFRIVYIDDDTFAPRTLTAAFPDRAAAEIAMAIHGHRVVQVVELNAGNTPRDHQEPTAPHGDASASRAGRAGRERLPPSSLGLPSYDLAGMAVVAAGIAMAGAAILLF